MRTVIIKNDRSRLNRNGTKLAIIMTVIGVRRWLLLLVRIVVGIRLSVMVVWWLGWNSSLWWIVRLIGVVRVLIWLEVVIIGRFVLV
jgi:hypothetical protein